MFQGLGCWVQGFGFGMSGLGFEFRACRVHEDAGFDLGSSLKPSTPDPKP